MRDKHRSFGAFVPANTQAPVLALSLTTCFVNLQVHFHDLALNKGERFLVETWNNIASEWWPLSGKRSRFVDLQPMLSIAFTHRGSSAPGWTTLGKKNNASA